MQYKKQFIALKLRTFYKNRKITNQVLPDRLTKRRAMCFNHENEETYEAEIKPYAHLQRAGTS